MKVKIVGQDLTVGGQLAHLAGDGCWEIWDVRGDLPWPIATTPDVTNPSRVSTDTLIGELLCREDGEYSLTPREIVCLWIFGPRHALRQLLGGLTEIDGLVVYSGVSPVVRVLCSNPVRIREARLLGRTFLPKRRY